MSLGGFGEPEPPIARLAAPSSVSDLAEPAKTLTDEFRTLLLFDLSRSHR